MLNPVFIHATSLSDAWFQCVYEILDKGHQYKIDKGSFEGQQRLEFDYVTVHITHPGVRPLIPDIPPALGIPNPVVEGYVEEYLPYLMTCEVKEGEAYTYGQRLTKYPFDSHHASCFMIQDSDMWENPHIVIRENGQTFLNQIEFVIRSFKHKGCGTNQMTMQVGAPSDLLLTDPPCLRTIDCRITDGKLHFMVYFRSWDLWGGMPANLAAIQLLKEYMADEIGVQDGEIIAASKGLHLYDYTWELAKLRTMRSEAGVQK
ncbi:MAG: thymidylate synthase [Desulfobacteraceae bacterium IS3]|nr:MAG: thymidylate synthase [Desulfobacteraceae bacterium IS3]